MKIEQVTMINAGDMSATIAGPLQSIDHMGYVAIQGVWTGLPTGTLKLQGSCDDVNFSDLSGFSQAAGGAAGNIIWNLANIGYKSVRAVYTATSGSGSLTVKAFGKGF